MSDQELGRADCDSESLPPPLSPDHSQSDAAQSDAALRNLLQEKFGWDKFKEGQEEVVSILISGHSALAVFPTGGGKSLCYQLPAVALNGLTVVVSPLIALMKDQIDQLSERGIKAVRLDSSLSGEEYRSAMSQLRDGSAKLLYVAPERFFNERFRSSLEGISISLFAIDEAHCISQWGHHFRPDYLKLAKIARELNVERVLALTATATAAVQQDICQAFSIDPEHCVGTSFFRPNLKLRTSMVSDADRTERLLQKLQSQNPGATIVYVTLQKTAEEFATSCQASGLDARAYHAGMAAETRNEIQDWFMKGQNRIVVATIAFGMGIDKSDIRSIYHFNPPKSIENYAQEIGRAGRDGAESHCEMLLVAEDRIVLENFAYGDTPTPAAVARLIDWIAEQDPMFFVSHYRLGLECDIKPIVLKTLLTYLELDGYLDSTAPRYEEYQFKPKISSAEMIDAFEGERKQFVEKLLACAVKRRIWFLIDIPAAVATLGEDRMRIVKALDYFAEKNWIELKVSGLVHGYRKSKSIQSKKQLIDELVDRVMQREASEISRIDQVFEFAKARQCQAASLTEYFGQSLEKGCGHCSFCVAGPLVENAQTSTAESNFELDDASRQLILELRNQHPVALESPRNISRFLCGLTSPAMTRTKLSSHEWFGRFQRMPFGKVMEKIETELG